MAHGPECQDCGSLMQHVTENGVEFWRCWWADSSRKANHVNEAIDCGKPRGAEPRREKELVVW